MADEAFDPRALALLERMTAAYSRLKALDQRTEFFAELIPFDAPDSPFGIPQRPTEKPKTKTDAAGDAKPNETKKATKKAETMGRRLRLRYAFPNRLRLEMDAAEPGGDKPTRYLWDSDGKFFWTTIPEKNWYTREKAPARLADFRRLERLDASSLEMLMLLGLNPFAHVREQCDRLTWEGAATARETAVDVVALRSDARTSETVAKLYIGHEDLLLRRVVIETTPAVGPTTPGKIGDALDDLAPDDPNPAPLLQPDEPGDAPPLLDAPPPPPRDRRRKAVEDPHHLRKQHHAEPGVRLRHVPVCHSRQRAALRDGRADRRQKTQAAQSHAAQKAIPRYHSVAGA